MLAWILKNPSLALCGVLVAALLGGNIYLGSEYIAAVSEKATLVTKVSSYAVENDRLKFEKALLDRSAQNLRLEIDLTKKTQAELQDVLSKLIPQAARDAARLKEIENAPASDDGPLAPVLRRALDGLRQ